MSDVISLKEHLLALRESDVRYNAMVVSFQQLAVAAAFAAQKEALAIKDRGDTEALRLAREIQVYKDEKANQLREQITGERGLYATKIDLAAAVDKIEVTIRPVINGMTLQQGKGAGLDKGWAILIGLAVFVSAIAAIIVSIISQRGG
jgi:Flp pilus assembly protein TadB